MIENPIAQWIIGIVAVSMALLALWDLYFNEHDSDDHDLP